MLFRLVFLGLGLLPLVIVHVFFMMADVSQDLPLPLTVDATAEPLHAAAPRDTDAVVSAHAAIDYLVNLDSRLPTDYVPTDLVPLADYGIRTQKNPRSSEMQVRLAANNETTLPAELAALLAVCEATTGERLAIRSGYRSAATQAGLFARMGFAGGSTPAGTSEHQSGLAVDFSIAGGRFLSATDASFACLVTHASDHGFILSYPRGNRYLGGHAIFEPWHWRYVGRDAAGLVARFAPADPQAVLADLSYFRFLALHDFSSRDEALDFTRGMLARLERDTF